MEELKRSLMVSFKRAYELAESEEKNKNYKQALRLYLEAVKSLALLGKNAAEEDRETYKRLAEKIMAKSRELESKLEKPAEANKNEWFEKNVPEISFDDVAGLEDVKALVRERVIDPMNHPAIYESLKLKPGTGIMMFGPPGTGKTTVARAIAHEVNAPIAVVSCRSLVDKYLGEGEKKIHELFECARQYKTCVIFFDDFEGIATSRDKAHDAIARMIGQLLVELDGFNKNNNNMLVLAATNIPWSIDAALKRPGRLSIQAYISLPGADARLAMLKLQLKGVPAADDLDLRAYAQMADGFSGGDMKELCQFAKTYAAQRAIREKQDQGLVTHGDFMRAFEKVHPSVNAEQLMEYKEYMVENGLPLPPHM